MHQQLLDQISELKLKGLKEAYLLQMQTPNYLGSTVIGKQKVHNRYEYIGLSLMHQVQACIYVFRPSVCLSSSLVL